MTVNFKNSNILTLNMSMNKSKNEKFDIDLNIEIEVSGNVNVEYVTLIIYYENENNKTYRIDIEAYRVSVIPQLYNYINEFLEFYGLIDFYSIEEIVLLGYGKKCTVWILTSFITDEECKILKKLFLKLFSNKIKNQVRNAINDIDMLKSIATFWQLRIENPENMILYIIASIYWQFHKINIKNN